MDWRILVNLNTNIRQSMLKLSTHSSFHDLFLKYQQNEQPPLASMY